LGARITEIVTHYLDGYETAAERDAIKPLNLVVMVGSVPTDDTADAVAKVAHRLDVLQASPRQVGMQFVQAGRESVVSEALRVLERELLQGKHGKVRNIVDIAPWKASNSPREDDPNRVLTATDILTVLLGAVMRRCCQRWLATYRGSSLLSRLANDWLQRRDVRAPTAPGASLVEEAQREEGDKPPAESTAHDAPLQAAADEGSS
jgi:hypothetical protein